MASKMWERKKNHVAHCVVLPYPSQGHINPMVQFSKRLVQRGVKITLVNTVSISNTITRTNPTSFEIETISDGYDNGGLASAEGIEAYKDTFSRVGSQTLADLLLKLQSSSNPVDCVIYDAFMPWVVDVSKSFELKVAVFLTQACSVNSINFHAFQKSLQLPISDTEILLPGLPKLAPEDLPSFLFKYGTDLGYFDLLLNQFSEIDKVDWVLANTFYELEAEVTDLCSSKLH